MEEEFFDKLREKVLPYFEEGDGHGFDHVERVYENALLISMDEDVDMDIIKATVLLHDIARVKEGREGICHAVEGSKIATEILKEIGFPRKKIGKVIYAIEVHRYSKGLKAESREAEILQDADRLDALGATIIVRMVQVAVKWGYPVYDDSIHIKKSYDGSISSVINHIHEKILKIKPETFKTAKAREVARGRYDFVKEFADRYVGEMEGEL